MATPGKKDEGMNTSEYRAVQHNYSPLVKRLESNLVEMANEFFSKELISKSELDEVLRQPVKNTASAILSSVMTKIEGNIKWYCKLIVILESSDLKDIAEDIKNSKAQDEDQNQYLPVLNKEPNSSSALPLQSALHQPTSFSSQDKNLEEETLEVDSAYSESQTDIQNEDSVGNTTCFPPSQPQADLLLNNPSLLSENTNCAEETKDPLDNGKDDLEVGSRHDLPGDHLQCKLEKADLNLEKDKLQAEIKCLETKYDEEKKALKEKEKLVSDLKQEMSKKDNVIENLKENQAKKDEEIKRLRTEKDEMEARMRDLKMYHEAKEQKRVDEVKEEYQAKLDSLTKQLEEAEEEKTRAFMKIEAIEKELKEERKKEELAQIEIERMNTKLAKLELYKEKELNNYKLLEQELRFQIENEHKTKEAEMATKDKELAEANLKIEAMKNEELRRQLEELKLKNNNPP